MSEFRGRRKPYTAIGIGRIPCARCGRPSVHQWAVCANGNRYLGVCTECDILLNTMALMFFRFPKNLRARLMSAYRRFATQSTPRGNHGKG